MSSEMSSPWKRQPDGFTSVLSSAACEWFLMFMLFVDATFSYLVAKFARFCELEPPCLLCTRIDHGFGKKKPGFYLSLLCSEHREEMTSLVSCSIHGRLANVRTMCDECLASITMQNNVTCSCCNGILTARSRVNLRPPLPRTPHSIRLCHKDSLKRVRERFIGPLSNQPSWRNSAGVDRMSNVAYTKLKLNSDSESELAHSEDDDDVNAEERDSGQSLDKPLSGIERQTDQGVEAKALALDRPHILDLKKHKNLDAVSADVSVSVLQEKSESSESLPHMPAISVLSEILSVCSVPPLPGITTPKHPEGTHSVDALLSEKNDVHRVKPSILGGKTLEQSDRNALEPISTSGSAKIEERNAWKPINTTVSAKTEDTHHVKASIHGGRALEQSDRNPLKPINTTGSAKSEELQHVKALIHGGTSLEQAEKKALEPVNTSSSAKVEDMGKSSKGAHQKHDEISASDNEGEDVVDQLRRQIESDQSRLSALYKELEEERNASAIAAEEAMAMITRLQEEKAALRMEALHYLRMMEEQSAYDSQALERANDLLAEREKELQDLEYELESYRGNMAYEGEEDDAEETPVLDSQTSAHTETTFGDSES